jgi:hypothetical protein
MLIRQVLYLVNVLVGAFEKTIGWIVGVMGSLYLFCGHKIVVKLALEILESASKVLRAGKRYLEQVDRTLRYRLYFEAVVQPMRTRYRELKRK